MGIRVCGIGIVSSVGMGWEENFNSLLQPRCGLGEITLFESALKVPVGEVKYSNGELKHLLGLNSGQTVSRTALLGGVAVKEALTDAGIRPGKRVGLISSTSVGGMDLSEQFYKSFLQNPFSGRLREVAGHDCAAGTDFIAALCGIAGFRTTLSTACSSAANAIMMGARMLERGMLDYVVVGGCDALCRFTLNGFNSLLILDQGLCRPMDRDRRGLNLGEGAGYLVLTKEEDGGEAYCWLSGYANANDAFHQTASSDLGEGAYRAMTEALKQAGISSGEIDYLNLHGTGTENNDASELAAVKRVFGENVPACSSTKSFTGHTLAAAGGIEAVYSVLSVFKGAVYANLRFEHSMEGGIVPVLEGDTGLEIRNVLSNSFGFGGNCSSLIFSRR